MPNCAAWECTNRSSQKRQLSFHRVPSENRDPVRRKRWIQNIRREGELPKDCYIYSEQFTEDSFERNLVSVSTCSFLKKCSNLNQGNLRNKYLAKQQIFLAILIRTSILSSHD